jgi:hypothetical protein
MQEASLSTEERITFLEEYSKEYSVPAWSLSSYNQISSKLTALSALLLF